MRSTSFVVAAPPRPFWAARALDTVSSWREMFSRRTLGADIASGLSVACVALPLNLALSIACGLPPAVGVISGVVGGFVAAAIGGHRFQISGPEAALVPIGAEIVRRHGAEGLVAATLLVGLAQVALGLLRVGRWARLVPRPVIAGFMTAIGAVIVWTQLPRLFGLAPELGSPLALLDPMTGVQWAGVAAGAAVILVMFALPRAVPGVPAALVGLVAVTAAAGALGGDLRVVGALPAGIPAPSLPQLAGVDLAGLLPLAASLLLLASLGSLLSALALDSLPRRRDDAGRAAPDQELLAQGLGNLASALVCGMPIMGAIVRSSVAVQTGARTRAASLFHTVMLLGALLVAAPAVARIPVAALAAILVVVGVRLMNLEGLMLNIRQAKTEAAILIVTTAAIVATNFIFGIALGLSLALALYLRRNGWLGVTLSVPDGAADVTVARIHGPLVFLTAPRLIQEVEHAQQAGRTLLLDMAGVPLVDTAGVEVLDRVVRGAVASGARVRIAGARAEVREAIEAAPVLTLLDGQRLHESVDEALGLSSERQPEPRGDRSHQVPHPSGRREPAHAMAA